jgi:chaperonin cofactor prefoldin
MAEEIKDAAAAVMTAFEEFKTTNDARLTEIEKKGAADPLLDDKLGKINDSARPVRRVSQKLTVLEAQEKALKAVDERFDTIETQMKRLGRGTPDTTEERKTRGNDWARAVVNAHVVGVANLGETERKAIEAVNAEWKSLAVSPTPPAATSPRASSCRRSSRPKS